MVVVGGSLGGGSWVGVGEGVWGGEFVSGERGESWRKGGRGVELAK